jgi:hypothetical protein
MFGFSLALVDGNNQGRLERTGDHPGGSLAMGAARTLPPRFRTEAGISSTPRALVGLSLQMVFLILDSFANLNSKYLF